MAGIIDFIKAVAGICETEPLDGSAWTKDGSEVKVQLDKAKGLTEPWAAVYLQGSELEKPILIVRDDKGELFCFSNKCTHMGRKLDPVPGERVLRCCSVNHSTFDFDGKALKGPTKGNLATYPCSVDGNVLTITV